MPASRTLPLYDPASHPSVWNERMTPGEFAVHFSRRQSSAVASCIVFPSLAEAEAFATAEVRTHTDLRCRIYDHHGFIGAPLREIAGPRFKAGDLSPRLRRALGLLFFLSGIGLIAYDGLHGFGGEWPVLLGSALILPGIILLLFELLGSLQKRQNAAFNNRQG